MLPISELDKEMWRFPILLGYFESHVLGDLGIDSGLVEGLAVEVDQEALAPKDSSARINCRRREAHAMHGFGIFWACGKIGGGVPFA